MNVRIASSAYGIELRAAALIDVVLEALAQVSEGDGRDEEHADRRLC